jgi:transposase InsO family protein
LDIKALNVLSQAFVHDVIGQECLARLKTIVGVVNDVLYLRCNNRLLSQLWGHLIANKPLQILAIDFTALEPAHGNENVLVMTDIFTRFTRAVPIKDQKAETVANALLNEWFYVYGVPERLHSDQDRNCESDVIRQLCKLFQIAISWTTPYHPEGNAQCDR